MANLLVKEKKGGTFRLLDLDTGITIRAFERDFPEVDFIVGTLFICTYEEAYLGYLGALSVEMETVGDSSKKRVEVCTEEVSIGDLIDGVPIVNFGAKYAKKGRKMAYAYFK